MINKQQVAVELRQEAERLTKAADLLLPITPQTVAAPITHNKIGRRKMTKASRAKISAAQKARWATKQPSAQENAA